MLSTSCPNSSSVMLSSIAVNPKTFFPLKDSGAIGKYFRSVLGENESALGLQFIGSVVLVAGKENDGVSGA